MAEKTADFFENNSHALREPEIVLRDSLGLLAIEILKNKYPKFAGLDRATMLVELREIISDLHDEYHRQGF